jgi:WD40 repeat protein
MLILQTDPKAQIKRLAFAPDGRALAVAGERFAGVGLFDLDRAKERLRYRRHGAGISSLAFAPAGGLVASADTGGTVRVWGAADGIDAHTFHTWGFGRQGVKVAFAPDGGTLAAGCAAWWGSQAQVRRWELAGGRELTPFRGHRERITALAFSPDGQTLATGSKDCSIRQWDARSGTERSGFASRVNDFLRLLGLGKADDEARSEIDNETEIRDLVFSPDGRTLATATGQRACLWDVATGKLLANLNRKRDKHCKLVDAVAFSPDGRTLATASRDGTVKFWDVSAIDRRADGDPDRAGAAVAATYAWDVGKVYAVAFAPDGLRCAAGGDGGQIVVWDVDG